MHINFILKKKMSTLLKCYTFLIKYRGLVKKNSRYSIMQTHCETNKNMNFSMVNNI